ncbi:DNA phosphorothioation-associated putative methyltransferase [Amycolatopsis pigmentata]|uniref:DNA phosphorothioation-associated putative methyltransferase n=1 Tax=Amycolatopsis pigmentata TaxID=450801 RepID=A0ABW5FWM5_9PSEU
MTTVERGRTAMMRTGLSKPLSIALADDLLTPDTSVFDYGCGRGGDVLRLKTLGYDASGWDPNHAADLPRKEADVVNLGYVVNVIEDPHERVSVLHSAWSLARRALIVAARPDWEARYVQGRSHGDGIITTKGTFQKFFKQDELRAWIDNYLTVRSIAAAPGVFYVFREDSTSHTFLANRVRNRRAYRRVEIDESLLETQRSALQPLVDFVAERGRVPDVTEIPNSDELKNTFPTVKHAIAVIRQTIPNDTWARAQEAARRDLTVYLALTAFGGRTKFTNLPEDIQFDVKALYDSYRAACESADQLLFSLADQAALNKACSSAAFGKLTPEALYVHVSAINRLDPVLRVYEGCGRALTGTVDGATLVKLNRVEPKVSYLNYPEFDRDPHPALNTSLRADLRRLHVKYTDFGSSQNPPILHRKETFVADDYPRRDTFARLTSQEERASLLDDARAIGTQERWKARLDQAGLRLAGHRLVRARPAE